MRKLLLGVAFCMVSTGSYAQNKEVGQPDWVEQAKMVAQMEGISVGEAIRRGKLEKKMAEQAAILENYPAYAGSEIVRDKSRYKIVHNFTDGRKTVNDSELDKDGEFRSARFSVKEMKAFQKSISTQLFQIDSKAYTELSPRENKVYVYTSKPSETKAALSTIGVIPDFVEIKSGGWYTSSDAAMMGGGAISATSGSCTAGFNVKGSVTGVSTAAHCIPYNLQKYQNVSIGTHRGPAYSKGTTDMPGRDFTWYRNDANTYNNAVKYQTGFYTVSAVGSSNPAANTTICLIKQNDTQSCAYVSSVATPPGGTYPAVIMDRDISVPGDSGGPWLYGSVAYGINQGRKCDDPQLTVNCRSLYSSAANMPAVLGVSVITQ